MPQNYISHCFIFTKFTKIDFFRSFFQNHFAVAIVKQGNDFDIPLFRATVLDLIESLNGPGSLNGTRYFHEILDAAISCLRCPCALEKHQNELSNYAKWIVAEFIRHGFDTESQEGLQGIFSRILRLGELKKSKKPHLVPFPLPIELDKKRNKPGFKKALNEYISPDPFSNQFKGFLHNLQKDQNGDILMRVDNVQIVHKAPFKFEYNGVTFLTFDQIEVDKKQWIEKMPDSDKQILGAKDGLVAMVSLKFKTSEQAVNQSRFLINRALDALCYVTEDKGANLIKNHAYILLEDGKLISYNRKKDLISIRTHDIEILDNFNNTIPVPEITNLEIRRYLEQCDRIFFKGLSREEPDDVISYFWQYWEASFNFGEYTDAKKGEKIIGGLSKILAKSSDLAVRRKLGTIICDYAYNNIGNLGIPKEFYNKYFDREKPEEMIQEISDCTDYPFLRELVDRFKNINQIEEEMKWVSFYTGFLWQLYEQRNMISHQGKYCAATLDQLKFFFKEIGSRWRAKLFNELERNTHNSIEDVIKQLVAEAEVIPS